MYNDVMGGDCPPSSGVGLSTSTLDPVRNVLLRARRERAVRDAFPVERLYRAVFGREKCNASYRYAHDALTLDFLLTLQLQAFEGGMHVPEGADDDALDALLVQFRDAQNASQRDVELRSMLFL